MMGFGGIFGILLIGVIIWAVIQLTNKNDSSNSFDTSRNKIDGGEKDALDIIKKRYARGEINRDEYARLKQDLRQS
jgi:putative membrane protein